MISHSLTETRNLGLRLAQQLRAGDVLLLEGDLGAGKSELTRGIAAGLGIEGPIPSPSFTILNVYDSGRLPLYLFDWYRLREAEELYELGLDEYLGGDGVAVIEWPSRCPEAVPETHLTICLTPIDEGTRMIELCPEGAFRSLNDLEEATA